MNAIIFFMLASFLFMGVAVVWGLIFRIITWPVMLIADRRRSAKNE